MMTSMKKLLTFGLFWSVVLFMFSLAFGVQTPWAGAGEQGGTIKGMVESPYVSQYPALVYIDHVNGEFPPSKANPHMSQKGMVFMPHILPVLKGSTVDFTNDDTVAHNVFSPPGSATSFNLGIYGSGVKKTQTFNHLGEVPLLCSIHPEMSAFVIVLQNPYFDLTGKTGTFEIKNVPPGTYQLKVWDEKLKETSQQVTVKAGKTTNAIFKGLTKR
ncbi:MAG: carboxypeptidase regulatory-like domain-containing protein [Desulfobacterales bacterium]